jgi:hypothetical protein
MLLGCRDSRVTQAQMRYGSSRSSNLNHRE